VSLIQYVQSAKDTLHHTDKLFIELIVLELTRLQLEIVGLGVASLATVMARGRNSLGVLLLLSGSMMRLGKSRTRFTFLWLLLLDLGLLSMDLWTMRSNVTVGATMMAGRQTSFVGMLLNSLCRFNINILANNNALTSLRCMSPMGRNIFRYGRLFNFNFLGSILLIPRSLGFQQITIWSNVTNNPTIMTCRNKLILSLFS
jgi:hypothetical protein